MIAPAIATMCSISACMPLPTLDDATVLSGSFPISGAIEPGPTSTGLYRTVTPFEHADSGRTHVYPADFGGALDPAGRNVVVAREFTGRFPVPYNCVTRESNELFVYGGTVADFPGSGTAYLVKYNTDTGAVVWDRTLRASRELGEMVWPGLVTAHGNGDLYVIFGAQLARIDAETGDLLQQIQLPLPEGAALEDIVYNGFTVLSDGTIVTKSWGRQPGCEQHTPCDEAAFGPLPPSLVVAIDPDTMDVLDQFQLDEASGGRITSTPGTDGELVFVAGTNNILRLDWDGATFSLNEDWGPVFYLEDGQAAASAATIMNDWLVFQTNALPSEAPLSVVAVNINDDQNVLRIDPFADSRIPISVIPSALTVDPANNRIYAMDTGPGQIAAIDLVDNAALRVAWRVDQRTLSHTSIVGPADARVFVSTEYVEQRLDRLLSSLSDGTAREQVVWRRASDGLELARSESLPLMTPGSPVAPGFFGTWYFLSLDGVLTELTVYQSDSR
jgi:outer membrane protein assembly factor BamB